MNIEEHIEDMRARNNIVELAERKFGDIGSLYVGTGMHLQSVPIEDSSDLEELKRLRELYVDLNARINGEADKSKGRKVADENNKKEKRVKDEKVDKNSTEEKKNKENTMGSFADELRSIN
ncbi:MAG: hypothetical protein K6E56_04820, partial [Lachnospiraceae bacterium]|nr:hypothetical protein [Lachnospiraceae bacterium]